MRKPFSSLALPLLVVCAVAPAQASENRCRLAEGSNSVAEAASEYLHQAEEFETAAKEGTVTAVRLSHKLQALEAYAHVVDCEPGKSVTPWVRLATEALENSAWLALAYEVNEGLKHFPSSAELKLLKGKWLLFQAKFLEAHLICEELVAALRPSDGSFPPHYEDALRCEGVSSLEAGLIRKARETLSLLADKVSTQPGSSHIDFLVARAFETGFDNKRYSKGADLDKAAEWYQKTFDKNDNQLGAAFQLALVYSQKADYARALEWTEKVLTLDPRSEVAQYNRACFLTRLGKHAEAIVALDRAVDLGFRDADHMMRDPDLATLIPTAEFKTFMSKRFSATQQSALPRPVRRK
jgi:tetratricopeptide (TPR) repeat protein